MSNKRRNRRATGTARPGIIDRAREQMKLAANVTEEQDWYLDTPDIRLTKIFMVVLFLHALAIGGVVAFKMIDKASAETGVTITSASTPYETTVAQEKEVAVAVPARETPSEPVARERPQTAAPLRRDPHYENQYKVQAGDKLADIAAELGVSPEALRKENAIVSDNELYPGRWLRIPGKETAEAAPEAPAAPAAAAQAPVVVAKPAEPAAAAQGTKSYVVQRGDTAWGIARKHNISYNELMKLNGITSPETLQIGRTLRVP